MTPMELGWCLKSIRQICNFAVALHRDRVGSGVRPDVAEMGSYWRLHEVSHRGIIDTKR